MDTGSLSPASSVNSFPVSQESEDIYSKYQRLAAQYAQVRAQVLVLRKGLLDEREKSSQSRDAEVGKSQKLRSLQQEIDGLSFRNGQLTKRVSVLQEELDTMSKKKNKNSKGQSNNVTSKDIASIHIEELESKIRENEMLHSKVESIESEYKGQLAQAQEQIISLQRATNENSTLLTVSKADYEERISAEQRKSVTLQVQLEKLNKSLSATKVAIKEEEIVKSPVKKRKSYEGLNLLATDKKRGGMIEQTISTMQTYVSDYSHSLLNYCTYLEQRIRIHSEEVGDMLTSTDQQLCSLLLQNAVVIRPLDTAYTTFVTTARACTNSLKSCSGLKDLSAVHTVVVDYLVNVFTLLQQSVTEENTLMSCSVEMERCNTALCNTFPPLCNALTNADNSLHKVTTVDDPLTAKQHVPALIQSLKELSVALKSTLTATHPKLSLCHKLAVVTQRLKTTDECAMGSLQMFLTTINKMSSHLEGCGSLILVSSRFGSDTVSPYAQELTAKCQQFMQSVARAPSSTPSTPSPEPIGCESTVLVQELAMSKERSHKLEQDKEHWMLEAQLLSIKLEKLQKRLDSAEEDARNPMSNKPSSDSVDNLLDLTPTTNVHSLSPWDDSGLREDAIRSHFLNRTQVLTLANTSLHPIFSKKTKDIGDIGDMSSPPILTLDSQSQMQKSEGCSLMYRKECKNFKKRLLAAEKQQNHLAIEIGNSDQRKRALEEELKLIKDKYEGQIALMSEHLCGMNDKLVQLNEENNQLRDRRR